MRRLPTVNPEIKLAVTAGVVIGVLVATVTLAVALGN
jgi:hypothetical protein